MTNTDDRIEPCLCMKRGDVVRLIPEVKPNLAIQAFEAAVFASVTGDQFGGIEITQEDAEGASYGGEFDPHVITPHGARLLRKLFEAGLIEQKRRNASQDLSELEAYISTEIELLDRSAELREQRAAEREMREAEWRAFDDRAKAIAQDPSIAEIQEISVRLIDRVFIHARGYGQGGMIFLAGCECHKEIDRYVSNSGITRRSTPYCWWFDPEGVRHGETVPEAAPNRRSDPARNWGAGRE